MPILASIFDAPIGARPNRHPKISPLRLLTTMSIYQSDADERNETRRVIETLRDDIGHYRRQIDSTNDKRLIEELTDAISDLEEKIEHLQFDLR
jgi:hypothetical protein